MAASALDTYQQAAMRTYDPRLDQDQALALVGLGVSGEAGEVTDAIKKVLFHDRKLDADALALELGDVLWYIAVGAHVLGLTLQDIADRNVAKLARRYPGGFPGGTPKAPTVAALPMSATALAAPVRAKVVEADVKPASADVTVRAKADIPTFVLPNGGTMQIRSGDLAQVPKNIADLLVRRQKADVIEVAA